MDRELCDILNRYRRFRIKQYHNVLGEYYIRFRFNKTRTLIKCLSDIFLYKGMMGDSNFIRIGVVRSSSSSFLRLLIVIENNRIRHE